MRQLHVLTNPRLCTLCLSSSFTLPSRWERAAGGFMLQPDPAMNANQALPSPLIANRVLCPTGPPLPFLHPSQNKNLLTTPLQFYSQDLIAETVKRITSTSFLLYGCPLPTRSAKASYHCSFSGKFFPNLPSPHPLLAA